LGGSNVGSAIKRTPADNIALPLQIAGWSTGDLAVRISELADPVGIAKFVVEKLPASPPPD
jgi:ABC-type methionine transport system ATPase subunit